jgi:hypothetical protein
VLKVLFKFFIFSSVYLGLSAALLFVGQTAYLTGKFDAGDFFRIFFPIFFVYNLPILQLKSRPKSAKWSFLYEKRVVVYIGLSLSLILSLFFFRPEPHPALWVACVLILSYMSGYHRLSLRIRFPKLKPFAVGLVWALFFFSQMPDCTDRNLLFVGNFFFISGLTVPFELRDRKEDHRSGLSTLGNSLSFRQNVSISVFCLFVSSSLYSSILNSLWAFVFFLPVLLLLSAAIFVKRFFVKDFFYTVILDGFIVFQAIVFLFSGEATLF